MTVEWEGQREDVLVALDFLAADPPRLAACPDMHWPDRRNAVHWLVDDTWWDHRDPAESIGTILRSEQEAAAVRRVVVAVVGISHRQGPTASDGAWLADEGWQRVQKAAQDAAAVLRAG